MKHRLKASPADEIQQAMLADQIWNEVCEHCATNIDAECISSGINKKQNLFYGRFYPRFSNDTTLLPPFPIITQQYFVNNDVYFVRSTDLPTAKQMPFFIVCVCFVKSGDNIKNNGLYSKVVANHPTINVYIQLHIQYMTNYLLIQKGFQRLQNLFGDKRSTFVHEFTHMIDDAKYDIGKGHDSTKGLSFYVNLNHEINARYLQIVHNIIDRLAQMDVLDDFHTHFPTFQSFYSHYWTAESGAIPEALYLYISPQNKKRLQTRLYGFYRYLIEQEIKNKIDKEQAVLYAQQQIIAD